jgi:hypothetical protein
MLAVRVYSDEWDVDQRLQPFGVTRAELLRIVPLIAGARADSVDDDPLSAAGQFAYIYGTRYVRGLFRSKKYLLHREQGIEAVRHPDRDLKIVYQSVDLAASRGHEPRAISGKGSGAERLITQGMLFSEKELESLNPSTVTPINTGVWFFCVSINDDDIAAELSLPSKVTGDNFGKFIERIFILWPGQPAKSMTDSDDGAVEFEPAVSRK